MSDDVDGCDCGSESGSSEQLAAWVAQRHRSCDWTRCSSVPHPLAAIGKRRDAKSSPPWMPQASTNQGAACWKR
jgi:hypothetical protein